MSLYTSTAKKWEIAGYIKICHQKLKKNNDGII